MLAEQEKKEQINIININDKLTPSLVKKCTIFCKKSSKRNFITIGLFLFIFSFLSILDFVYYEKAKIKKQNLSIIRNEYNDLKRNFVSNDNCNFLHKNDIHGISNNHINLETHKEMQFHYEFLILYTYE